MKRTLHHIKLASVTALLLATAVAFGFEKDRPKNSQFGPEQSQAQLSQQQSFQGNVPPVGIVEERIDAIQPQGSMGGDSDSSSFSNAEEAKVKASFNTATHKIKEARNPMSPFLTLMLLCGVILVATMAIKAYSDKVVPVPKHLK